MGQLGAVRRTAIVGKTYGGERIYATFGHCGTGPRCPHLHSLGKGANKPPLREGPAHVTTMSSAEPTRRDFLYIATGAVAAVGAGAALVPLIAQMNPDASTIAAGAPIEVDLAPIAEGQVIKVFWRGKPIYVNHRTKKQIEEAENVDVAKLPDPQPDSARVKPGHSAVAGPDRNLHPSRLHPDRPSGPIRRLLLPLPRLGLRHLRPHPQRTRAASILHCLPTSSSPTPRSGSADGPATSSSKVRS